MNTKLKDFDIDHKLIRCEETPKMVLIAKQIADLQAEYDKLREKEQRSQFAAFLSIVREKSGKRSLKEYGYLG